MTIDSFEALPMDVQWRALGYLRAFNDCLIVYEYGAFQVGGGACLKDVYGADHKVFGSVYAEDIYTPEERIQNYIEEFHSYPIEYKGKRDYAMLRRMKTMRSNGIEAKIQLIDGNAELPIAGRVCRRCKSSVWRSELKDYSFQCFECEENLYKFETEVRLELDNISRR